MRLPFWVLRLLHRNRLSRGRLRGTSLHRWFGDRLLDRGLWRPTRESMARAWLVGFPITALPFLPFQSVLACVAALFVRGNLLLCIALQFLSSPLTAPVHLPLCFGIGEVISGRSPVEVWREMGHPGDLLKGESLGSLYLGSVVLGLVGGLLGYLLIHGTWRKHWFQRPRTKIVAAPTPASRTCETPASSSDPLP